MSKSAIISGLKTLAKECSSDDAGNRIVPYLGVNMENLSDKDQAFFDGILTLAVNVEKPGRFTEEKRLRYYRELIRAIDAL
jgi:hypothetical protein